MSITDDLRMAMARVWDEWADLHGVAAPAHIVDAWLSVTIAADALDSEVAALTAQRDALAALVARIAVPATQYNARVYRLTDDFEALRPYLSDEDVRRAEERPSESDARVAAQRDAARGDAIRDALRAMTKIEQESERTDLAYYEGLLDAGEAVAALAGASPVAADPPTDRTPRCDFAAEHGYHVDVLGHGQATCCGPEQSPFPLPVPFTGRADR